MDIEAFHDSSQIAAFSSGLSFFTVSASGLREKPFFSSAGERETVFYVLGDQGVHKF